MGSPYCQAQCLNAGRYCQQDPDGAGPYSGAAVVRLNLISLCVARMAAEDAAPWLWWDYAVGFERAVRAPLARGGCGPRSKVPLTLPRPLSSLVLTLSHAPHPHPPAARRQCPMGSTAPTASESCARDVMAALPGGRMSPGRLRTCAGDTGSDAPNAVLQAERDAQLASSASPTRGDIFFFPTVVANDVQ